MNWSTLVEIKQYLQSIKPLFVEGNIRLISEWWYIKVAYKDCFLDFSIKEKLGNLDKEDLYKVIDFCFDCYFDYEWKWEAMNSEILGRLLNLRPWSVRAILSRVYFKLNTYGKPVLKEK